MFKNIIVRKSEAMKMPVEVRDKNGIIKEAADDFNFNKAFVLFTDAIGAKYLITHGNRDGFLSYNMNDGNKANKGLCISMLYEMLIDKGLVNINETLNIICCYGNKAIETQKNLDSMGLIHRYPMNVKIINKTNRPCTSIVTSLKSGLFRVSIFDMDIVDGKITKAGMIKTYLNQIRSGF